MKRITAAIATLAATVIIGGCANAAHASTMHRVYILRYVPHTMMCKRSQDGAYGLVYGDGPKPFQVVCERFGKPYRNLPQRFAWDAEKW